jgi:hypothetical protein
MENADSVTVCCGFSSSSQALSTASLQPIANSPAGTSTTSPGSAVVVHWLAVSEPPLPVDPLVPLVVPAFESPLPFLSESFMLPHAASARALQDTT